MKLFRNLARAVAIAAVACSAIAQDSTSQPIRVILPFGPGSGTDNIARPLFDALSRELNQSFTIDNRPGASGIVAAEAVARAAPDGRTLLFTSNTLFSINPSLFKKLPYDPVKDFRPISSVTTAYYLLVVRKEMPVNNVTELIAWIKANPGTASYGWGGFREPNRCTRGRRSLQEQSASGDGSDWRAVILHVPGPRRRPAHHQRWPHETSRRDHSQTRFIVSGSSHHGRERHFRFRSFCLDRTVRACWCAGPLGQSTGGRDQEGDGQPGASKEVRKLLLADADSRRGRVCRVLEERPRRVGQACRVGGHRSGMKPTEWVEMTLLHQCTHAGNASGRPGGSPTPTPGGSDHLSWHQSAVRE